MVSGSRIRLSVKDNGFFEFALDFSEKGLILTMRCQQAAAGSLNWRKVRTPQSRESPFNGDAGDDMPRKGKCSRKQTAGCKSGKGEKAG